MACAVKEDQELNRWRLGQQVVKRQVSEEGVRLTLLRALAVDTPRPLDKEASVDDFVLDEIRFKVLMGEYRSRRTDADGVVLLKGKPFALAELNAMQGINPRRMLELGVFQGGSAALWMALLPQLERYVGVDIAHLAINFPEAVVNHPRWAAVRLRGETSQDDRAALERILTEEFATEPLDVIMDDASHSYGPSRASFEFLFPRVRPGGVYFIEDWSWAHWAGEWQTTLRYDDAALSNLVLRLMLISASRPDIISKMLVLRQFVAVYRGSADLADDFDLDAFLLTRGRVMPLL